MKIIDRKAGVMVDVADTKCHLRSCYWPRADPGIFVQGQGYRARPGAERNKAWMCGNREIRGCPNPLPEPGADEAERGKRNG